MSRKADGTVIAPVNTDDVSAAIGKNSHDIGTLCMYNGQSPWAKFKAMRHETSPAPYTNAERKAKYWGIQTVTKKASDSLTSYNIKWEHLLPQASDYKCLSDFVGDGADEGYNGAAAPIVEVNITQRAKLITAKFTFNRNVTPGGILPEEMMIEGLNNASLNTLYPGIIIYKFNSGTGKYDPLRIGTANVTVGKYSGLEIQEPASGLSNGDSIVVLPIFATQHILITSAIGRTDSVCLAPSSFCTFDVIDTNQGLLLFSRFMKPQLQTEYFTAKLGVSATTTQPFSFFTTTNLSLTLAPTDVMKTFQDGGFGKNGDRRVAITMTFTQASLNDYGLAEWNPVAAAIANDGTMSQSSYSSLVGSLRYIGLLKYEGGADGDEQYLCIKYSFLASDSYWVSSQKWKVTFTRSLVILDSGRQGYTNMETCNTGEGLGDWSNIVVDRGITASNVTTKIERIKRVQIANAVTSDYSSRGVDIRLVGVNGNSSIAKNYSTSAGNAIRLDYSYGRLEFNVKSDWDALHKNVQKMPVNTSMYIDVTCDTIDTVDATIDSLVEG